MCVHGLVHKVQFFALGSSKMEVFFFDIMTTHDHPSYVKHVLRIIHVFFSPYLGIGCKGGR